MITFYIAINDYIYCDVAPPFPSKESWDTFTTKHKLVGPKGATGIGPLHLNTAQMLNQHPPVDEYTL